jgi:arylsulfatase A-like enzyme
VSSRIPRAFLSGALGGVVVGTLDALAARGSLLAAVHTGALYGLMTAVAAAALVGLAILVQRHSPLARPRLAQVLAGVPLFAAALAGAYLIGLDTIARRHHQGLIVAVVIAATVGFLLVALIAALLVAPAIELGLRRLRWPPLASPSAPLWAAALLIFIGAGVAALLARRTLALLPLRPFGAAAALAIASAAAWPLLRRPTAWFSALRHALLGGLLAALALFTGSDAAVRKHAARTGLAGSFAAVLQRLTDFDGDGTSSILGGGDCAPWDSSINPGAFDVPDDGVDQNCLGGDLRLDRKPEDVAFVPVPPEIPADANVVLITIDTLRADHVGAYGYGRATTPALDALAAEGTLFENGWAHAPSTRYSVPAILTGRYPSHVSWDMNVWWPALQPENQTLAEVLKSRGFATGAILNYSYFDRPRRMDQGFDSYDNANARLHVGHDPASTRGSSSRQQAEAAIRWLDEHAAGRFFLWLHFYDPHHQYESHEGTERFGDDELALYDHEIRFTDDQMATVLQRLRALGVWDKTVVIVTGDPGEGFGEHGVRFHGYHLYAPQTKVPFVVRVPGAAPRRVKTPAGHVDLLPTLANLVGAPPAPEMEGRSLLGEITGQAPADGDREIYQEVIFEGPSDAKTGTQRYAVVTKCRHLLHERLPADTWESYDLCADPAETKDRGREGGALEEKLLGWIDGLAIPLDAARKLRGALLTARPSPQLKLDADLGGAVRLLGADLPAELRAGGEARLVWYFEVLGRIDGDWRVFVHVEGPQGRFQGDHEPVQGAFPVSRWRKGQLIADAQDLRVPPHVRPGEYTVFAGLWSPKTRKNLGDQRVRVGTVKVVK